MNHIKQALATVPMPANIAALPRDKRGLPIPASAFIRPDGTPDFTVINPERWASLVKVRGCGVCGMPLEELLWFIGGPVSHQTHMFFDHPMHKECAEYALQVCSYLALPRMTYRKQQDRNVREVKGASSERGERTMLASTASYRVVQFQGEVFLQASEWITVQWWKEGKQLTEVEAT